MKKMTFALSFLVILLFASSDFATAFDFPYFQSSDADFWETSETDTDVVRGKSKNNDGYRAWADFYSYSGRIRPEDVPMGIERFDVRNAGMTFGVGFPRRGKNLSFFYSHASPEHALFTPSLSGVDIKVGGENNLFGTMLILDRSAFQFVGVASGGFDKYKYKTDIASDIGFDGWQANLYGEAGLEIPVASWNLRPHLGLGYHFLSVEEPFVNDSVRMDSCNSNLGVRALKGFMNNTLVFQTRFSWIHEFLSAEPVYQIYYGSQIGAMTPTQLFLSGYSGRDWCWFGTGLKYTFLGFLNTSLDYDLNFNEYQTIHIGSLTLSMKW